MTPNFDRVLGLLTHVPRPPGASEPSGASIEQLQDLEETLQQPIPAELKAWLLRCNGVIAGPGVLYGARPADHALDLATARAAWTEWAGHGWIPVASDGSGNAFVLQRPEPHEPSPVYFVDCSDNPDRLAYVVASSLESFLRFLLERELGEERWPFNSSYVLAEDPGIREIEGAPVPWHA